MQMRSEPDNQNSVISFVLSYAIDADAQWAG